MNNLLTSRHFQWWILFAGILLYVPSLWSGFISDDHKILALGLNHVQDKQFFRPGVFWFNQALFDTCDWCYHMVQLILWGCCCWLFYRFAAFILTDNYMQCIALAIFVFLPSHTDAVVWLSGIASLFAGCLVLLHWITLLQGFQTKKNAWFILSGASMVLAWCTYESSWAILILTPLLLYWKARPNFRQWLITMTLLISLFGVYLFFRIQYLGNWYGTYGEVHQQIKPFQFMFHAVRFLYRTFTLPSDSERMAYILLGCLVVTGFQLLFTKKLKEHRFTRSTVVLILCFFIALLPVLSFNVSMHSSEGERYLFLPAIFLVLAGTCLIQHLKKNIQLIITGTYCFVAAAGIVLIQTRWIEAGVHIRNLYTELQQYAFSNLRVIDLPTEAHSTYAYRIGFADGFTIYKQSPPKQLEIISTRIFHKWPGHQLKTKDDTLILRFIDQEPTSKDLR